MNENEKIEAEEIEAEFEEAEDALTESEEAEKNESEEAPKWVQKLMETQTAILNSLNQKPEQTKNELQEIEIPKPQEPETELQEPEQELQEPETELQEPEAPKQSKLKNLAKFLF